MYGKQELERAKEKLGHLEVPNRSYDLAGDLLGRAKEAAENLSSVLALLDRPAAGLAANRVRVGREMVWLCAPLGAGSQTSWMWAVRSAQLSSDWRGRFVLLVRPWAFLPRDQA